MKGKEVVLVARATESILGGIPVRNVTVLEDGGVDLSMCVLYDRVWTCCDEV